MVNISLITPTRNRISDLRNLLNSLMTTTADKSFIEILFAVDKDDVAMIPLIDSIKAEYSELNIKFFLVDRSDHFSKDYFNFLSKQAQGRWIMAINDDSVFVTDGWDKIIDENMSEAAKVAGDDILLGIVDDGMERHGDEKRNPGMSCWPLSSKEYITLMNGLLIEEIYTWGGDYWLGVVFKKVMYGKRKVYMTDVVIEHNSHHANPRRTIQLPQPESFPLFQRIQRDHPYSDVDLTFITKDMTEKINNYIKKLH